MWEVLDAAPDAMVVMDARGHITFANTQAERVFGYSPSELLGRPLDTLLPERFRARHLQHVTGYLSSPAVRPMGQGVELVGLRKDGREFPVDVALSSHQLAGATVVIAAVRDITARKQAEDELRRSHEDLAITLESIEDGVIVADRQGRVVRLNPAAERLTGWSAAEATGRNLDEVFRLVLDEEMYEPAPSPVPGATREGQVVGLAKGTMLMARDGAQRSVVDSCTVLRSGSGEIRGVVLVFRDTTPKVAENKSRLELERIQRHLDSEALSIVHLDRQGRIVYVNEAWSKFARENGADAKTTQGIGLDYVAATSRAEPAVAEALTEMVAGRRSTFTCIYPCHSPTEARWFRLAAARIAVDGVVVLSHADITDHYLAEARLSIQAVVAQALADGLPLLDTCGRIIRTTCELLEWDLAATWTLVDGTRMVCAEVWAKPGCNAGAFEKTTREITFEFGRGLPGRVWARRVPEVLRDIGTDPNFPRAAVAIANGFKSGFAVPLWAEEEVFAVLEFFSRSRREPDVALLELLRRSGAQVGAQVLLERARRHAALAEVERQKLGSTLNDIMACLPVFIMAVDESGRTQFVSKAQERSRQEEVIGSDWLQHLPAEEGEQARVRLRRVIEKGEFETYETRSTGPDGKSLWFSTRIGPMHQGERICGAILVSQEVTELKRAQADFAATQRLAAVGTLAAGVAHEINTPIQFINDSVHFLRDGNRDVMKLVEKLRQVRRLALDGVPDELRAAIAAADEGEEEADLPYLLENVPKAFARCLDGLDRVTTIVRSMKEFAHPAQQEMTPIDLNRAIENTLTIARNEYKYVAELETELGQLPLVSCLINDINQVVLNLVVNAAHSIGEVVKGSDKKGRLKVRTRSEGEHVIISIGDTGAGIPEAIAHRIFEPFFTTKEVGKGTGQGLALAWAVVTEKHAGQLTFESEVGKGTTFHIRLPIAGKQSKPNTGGIEE